MSLLKNRGRLYLIPTLLGNTEPEQVLPAGTIELMRQLDIFIVENIRTARRLLSRVKTEKPIDELVFLELNKHTKEQEMLDFLLPTFEGKSIGLMSEAGTPCVADPGNVIVEMAHQAGVEVMPLTGPNAMILALMASGFNGQSFAFHGYLPIQKQERVQALMGLQHRTETTGETQLFIETPFRNQALYETILQNCHSSLMLCLAVNISMPDQFIKSMSIADWKQQKPDMNKKPAVFLLWSPPKKQTRKR
jgi:16S rRNA (cytidine1402-2'-O)-methyltransferase